MLINRAINHLLFRGTTDKTLFRYNHPNIGSINLKTQLLKVKVSNTIHHILRVAR
jgi:hypothetical protein